MGEALGLGMGRREVGSLLWRIEPFLTLINWQIRELERGSSCLWILTQGVFISRHCYLRDVLNRGELKVEDAVTHSPEYLLSSSYISLLLFLRFFFFFFFNTVLFQYRSHHCPYVDVPLKEGPRQLWVVWSLGFIKRAVNSLKAHSRNHSFLSTPYPSSS